MRRPARGEAGFTLVETIVAMSILGLVMVVLLGALVRSQTSLQEQSARSQTNDQLRQAIEALDREVRSGDVVYDPAVESYAAGDVAPGMSARIFSQTNAPTRA